MPSLTKLVEPLDGLVSNGNDIASRTSGEIAKAKLVVNETLKILKAEFCQGLLAQKSAYIKDQLKDLPADVKAWYRNDISHAAEASGPFA